MIALHKNKGKSVAACLKSRTDYAQNPDKTQQGELVSSYECSPLTVDEEFMLSKRQYELMTGRRQKNDVIAYQIRQSFKPGEITAEEANKVGYELAMRFTKGKYAFIVATHTDREHIHNHIIVNELSRLGCKDGHGNVSWSCTKISRILRNATYMGYICYNKSKVNNYLEKKRINNLDEDSFVYVKGNFEPIVSESLWHECERIRKSRISSLRLPDGETRRKGTKTTKNLWVSKLRCRCGSSYRIFKWRKLKDGTPVFGYQCNMRTVNPTRSFVLEHSLTDQLSCDAISVPEWKLDLMAKKIFEKVWGNQNKAILLACQMIEGCKSGKPTTLISAAPIQSKIEKIKNRKMNYAAMRADGELGREEYQALCKQADDEINRLEQDLKSIAPEPDSAAVSANMKALHDFLEQKLDVRGACLAPELIEQFVEVVTPISDYTYRWKLNTGSKKEKHERADLMAVTGKPVLTFTIDFETAKKYREANKMPHQFRRAAWSDLTVEVYL